MCRISSLCHNCHFCRPPSLLVSIAYKYVCLMRRRFVGQSINWAMYRLLHQPILQPNKTSGADAAPPAPRAAREQHSRRPVPKQERRVPTDDCMASRRVLPATSPDGVGWRRLLSGSLGLALALVNQKSRLANQNSLASGTTADYASLVKCQVSSTTTILKFSL